MEARKKTKDGFVQKQEYAVHFGDYKKLLSHLLHHDPVMFDLPKNAKIIDIGCGYGDLLKLLKHRGYKNLMGIEPDKLCRMSCVKEGLDVREGTLIKTGLTKHTVDVAIVNQVFHHIDDYSGAAAELARIIKPNGVLCFLEPSPTPLRKLMDILTFYTPLAKLGGPINTRYKVMKLEMETGLYPHFLTHQKEFHNSLNQHFSKIWLRQSWFFQFGKFKNKG